MADFDEAIGVALEFAQKDGNTLVIVTADHETGGYALVGGSVAEKKVEGKFITKNHTGIMVPVFAFGPGAEAFAGFGDNTLIGKKIFEYLKK
jgi:alkaline phosphatase